MTNASGGPVAIESVRFDLPYAQEDTPADDALCTDPTAVTAAPGPTSPWAIAGGRPGSFTAVPLPPASGLSAGETAELVFGGIVMGTMGSEARVAVTETVLGDDGAPLPPGSGEIRVGKLAVAGGARAAASPSARLSVTQADAGPTLSWRTTDASRLVMETPAGAIDVTGITELTPPPRMTGVYRLHALGAGGTATDSATVG